MGTRPRGDICVWGLLKITAGFEACEEIAAGQFEWCWKSRPGLEKFAGRGVGDLGRVSFEARLVGLCSKVAGHS
ncbi:hypothetical protein L3X38_024697 [Prunus dulcis]|uniref:Uncharacterized protein n=1 Tax=Prunus dulcis TaxID=3755 RepID=A0AAD4W1W4_PRUDU|nr:hypothetical protein L3X38_024697 [Prunus dulcis]